MIGFTESVVEQAGLPPLEIEEGAGCVAVRFRPGLYLLPREVVQGLTVRQRSILAVLNASPRPLSLREIKSAVHRTGKEWELKEDLATLKALDVIDTAGHGRGATWFLRVTSSG